jgi:tetratricopeptide (TPR) repeat protein
MNPALVRATDQPVPPQAESDESSRLLEEIQEASSRSRQSTVDRRQRAEAAAAFAFGQRHEAAGDFDLARRYYRKAIEADPGYSATYIRMAFLEFRRERFQDGIDLLENALRQSEDHASLHSLRAFGLYQLRKPDLAIEEAKRSLAIDPTLTANYRILSSIYRDRNQRDQIDTLFEQALKVETDRSLALVRMAETWQAILGDRPESEVATRILPLLERAAKLDSEHPYIHLKLGETALLAADHAKASVALTQALKLNPNLPRVREQLALALLSQEKYQEAATVLEELVAAEPDRLNIYPLLAEIYENQDDFAKAAVHLETWINLSQPNVDGYLHLAQLHLRSKNPEASLRTVQRGLERFPNIPHLYFIRSLALRFQNKHEDALESMRRAETLARGDDEFLNPTFFFEYGAACEMAGEYEEAQRLFQKVLAMDQDHHMAMNYLGYMWAERRVSLPEAEKLILRALQFEAENPAYLDSLGWVYFQQGRYEEARTYLEKALKGLPEDPVILDHYGDVLLKLGHAEEALAAWKKALETSEEPDPIRAKIADHSKKVSLTQTPSP